MANGFMHDYIMMYPFDMSGFKKWCHQLLERKLYGRNKRYGLIYRIVSRQKQRILW